MNFLSENVPDPTDFPPQAVAPGLRTLDGSFRCDICGELYDGPVTIACGHCFCSACIRNCLLNKQECPTCRKSANEVHIRPNPVLEDVISAWKEARPFVLGLTKRENERAGEKEVSRKRKRTSEYPSSSSSLPGNTPGPSNRDVLSPTRNLKAMSPSKLAKKPRTQRDGNAEVNVVSSSESEEESIPQALKFAPKAEDLVECPLCEKKIIYRELNAHMDNKCKNDTAAKSWSLLLGGSKNGKQKGKHKKKDSSSDDEYPLPLTTYNTLKDRQLKDMLVDQELPITGNRSNWEQRHRQWIVLYNSNLDKSKPNRKTKADLRKDLKRWETENAKKKKTVIADVKAYQKEQKMEFAKLVEAARPKKVKSPPTEDVSAIVNTSPPPLPTSSSTAPGDAIEITSEDE